MPFSSKKETGRPMTRFERLRAAIMRHTGLYLQRIVTEDFGQGLPLFYTLYFRRGKRRLLVAAPLGRLEGEPEEVAANMASGVRAAFHAVTRDERRNPHRYAVK